MERFGEKISAEACSGKLGFLAEFGGVLYADHVRFHSCRPYMARASTDALILLGCFSISRYRMWLMSMHRLLVAV